MKNAFKGQYRHTIDSKGRLSIPAKLRKNFSDEANNTVVMSQGLEKCFYIYPKNNWIEIEERLFKLNEFLPKDSRFIRMMLQNAHEDSLDAQSRIIVPQNLIELAEIKNEIVIIGALKRLEVWDPEIYKQYLASSPETFQEIAAEVMRL